MRKSQRHQKSQLKYDLIGLSILLFGVIVLVSLIARESGVIISPIIEGFRLCVGLGVYFVPAGLILAGLFVIIKLEKVKPSNLLIGLGLFFSSFIGLIQALFTDGKTWPEITENAANGGGFLGAGLIFLLRNGFGNTASYVILGALLLVSVLIMVDVPLVHISAVLLGKLGRFFGELRRRVRYTRRKREVAPFEPIKAPLRTVAPAAPQERIFTASLQTPRGEGKETLQEARKFTEGYQIPPISILEGEEVEVQKGKPETPNNIRIIEDTLENFGIRAKVVEISRGPTVTRYEIQLAPGIKISKVTSLADDLAMALAAIDVRVEAPIPGKSAIGIEVPNPVISTVPLKEILETPEFKNASSKLVFGLGKDISGTPRVADLGKMPHLLIAGATGTGKTVCINSIIVSLLFRNSPEELKFLLIDPKRVELTLYDGIPHLVVPVIKDVREAARILRWAISEMERRYDLFAEKGARQIDGYNANLKEGEEYLPYIIICIDELADLMMQAPAEFEASICRLAQLARATGIHLVIATQRPSVDVITGTIKANISSRIAFAVASQVDSRIIIDMNGAERLLGNGDMLFLPMDSPKPVRIQGAYVSEREIEKLVEYLKKQAKPQFAAVQLEEEVKEREEIEDPLFEDAARLVVTTGYGSTSMLQRKFKIGYNRAARLMDLMENYGFVGPMDPANPQKPRKVLVTLEEIGDILKSK